MRDITNTPRLNQSNRMPNIIDNFNHLSKENKQNKYTFTNIPKTIYTNDTVIVPAAAAADTADARVDKTNTLSGILKESRNALDQVKIQIPSSSISVSSNTKSILDNALTYNLKNSNLGDKENIINIISDRNKKRILSEEANVDPVDVKLQSTPRRKQQQQLKEQVKEQIQQNDKLPSGEEQSTDDSEDKLACHANRILQMAVDSTMLSSFNSTSLPHITLYYSDEEDEGYIHEIENENDDSICGKNGARRKKRAERLKRIEINEDDLKAAISG